MADREAEIDALIAELEEALADADFCSFVASKETPPKPCVIQLESDGYLSAADRKPKEGLLLKLAENTARLRLQENIVKGQRVRLRMRMEKSSKGEVVYEGAGEVSLCRRIPGCYQADVEIGDLQKQEVPLRERFLGFAARSDFAGWNRWAGDLVGPPVLRDLNLRELVLANFDLCMADLSGSDLTGADLSHANLSGANLERCTLENVRVNGADLFGVRIPRADMGLLSAAGLVEVESAEVVA